MESTPPLVTRDQLTQWTESLLHINHLNTLVQREIAENSLSRAAQLSERARRRAWTMLNEMFAAGAASQKAIANRARLRGNPVRPNRSVNTDAPRARLRLRSGSPVTFVR